MEGGCVALGNNHWMRGGTYGWLAADRVVSESAGLQCREHACMGWTEPQDQGNNPLIMAVPRSNGNMQ